MTGNRHRQLVRMHPPDDTLYVSQGYTSLATDLDGFVCDGAGHGLFVHETRLLSRYRWLIEGALARNRGRPLARRAAGANAARGAHRPVGGAELQPAPPLLRLGPDLR